MTKKNAFPALLPNPQFLWPLFASVCVGSVVFFLHNCCQLAVVRQRLIVRFLGKIGSAGMGTIWDGVSDSAIHRCQKLARWFRWLGVAFALAVTSPTSLAESISSTPQDAGAADEIWNGVCPNARCSVFEATPAMACTRVAQLTFPEMGWQYTYSYHFVDVCYFTYVYGGTNIPIGAVHLIQSCSTGTLNAGRCIIQTCPSGQNWTLNGTTCTRPDTKASGPTCPSTLQPITLGDGNKWLVEKDLNGNGSPDFTRSYNSNPGTVAVGFGPRWRSIYSQFIGLGFSTAVWVYRPQGNSVRFNVSGTTYTPDADITDRLYKEGTGYRYHNAAEGSVERYDSVGRLLSITDRAGKAKILVYDIQNRLASVTDSFGRSLQFAYDGSNRVSVITTPAGNLTYTYAAAGNLSTVTYPDGKTKTYHYENTAFPNALTGITDENNNRYITYTYDSQGRAVGEVLAGNVGSNQLSFGTNQTTHHRC